jgi:hypothetical protein
MTWPMMRRIPSWLVVQQLQQFAWIVLPQTLLTLATILLSTLSFILLIAAGSSCNFVVSTSVGGLAESSAREEGYIDDGFVITTYEEQQYYYTSFGIFCEDNDNNSDSDSEGEVGALIFIVRLFYLLSLILTFSLVIMTLLWIMQLSTSSTSYSYYCTNNNNEEDKVWKRLAHLAITSIICHMPILLLLLDSRHHCTNDDDDDGGRCALGNGSLPYFLDMFALTALILLVKFNTMPDWKEEYELYKLVRQRDVEIEQLDDNMTIEKKKDGHNVIIEDPKNSTMMSDDDYYDNDNNNDDDDDNENRENMDEERRVVNCLMNVRIHSSTERRRRCPTIPPLIICPVSEDDDNNSSMMMTMMMPTNTISKSPRRYKGIEEQEQQQQPRTSSSPTSVIVDNYDCEFQSPPLPTPVCSVMVVNDEELGHHHPSFNNTYLQLSFSTINNNNQVQIMSSDDEVMHNNIPQSNDYDDSENVNPENDNQYSSSCNDSKGSNTTNDNICVNRSSTKLNPTRIVNLAKEGVHQYNDPELDMYPSDSSVSELSLDSEDEHQDQQSIPHSRQDASVHNNDIQTKIAKADCSSIYLSDSSADGGEFTSDDNDSESEMYTIIAGVRKLNRRMSGKAAPQYKRQRRRKGMSDVLTVKSFTSHGSLLDKIIPEELTEGDVTSPPRLTSSTRKKKKREDHHHQHHHDGEVDDCYPSLNHSDEVSTYDELQSLQSSSPVKEIESKKYDHNSENDIHQLLEKSGDISFGSSSGDGGDVVSDYDESMSLRASQARKQRILSAQRVSLLPHDSDKDEYNDDFRGITNSPPSLAVTGLVACENQLHDASKDSNIDRNSNHINSAWQARQVRMARLRMSRGEQEKPSPTLEPEGKIFRAIDSVVAYSDENSI